MKNHILKEERNISNKQLAHTHHRIGNKRTSKAQHQLKKINTKYQKQKTEKQ
jgi:hypothetical protein